MLPVTIKGPKDSIPVLAFLDDGSSVTMIDSTIIDKIGAARTSVNVSLKGLGGDKALVHSYAKASLKILGSSREFSLHNVLIVDNLSLPVQRIDASLIQKCAKETGIHLSPYSGMPVILIGQEHSNLIVTREFREIEGDALLVSRCLLGCSIHGRVYDQSSAKFFVVNQVSTVPRKSNRQRDNDLHELVRSYFDIDSLGISCHTRVKSEDRRAIEILDKTCKWSNGSWSVGLLWKSDEVNSQNGRATAIRRLRILEEKLDRDEKFAKLYYREMDRLLDNKFAQRAENRPTQQRVWFLPHFGITNVNKPDRVRVVFDAKAKTKNVSFNDMLLPGPDLLKSLPGVIMRFRQFCYAFKADFQDMFLKIKIQTEDLDAQRFLWRGRDRSIEPQEHIMTSMFFGSCASPCSAIYVKNCNASFFLSKYPAAANSIIENTYMDDYLDSCETAEEASNRVREVIEINAHADWVMHKWASNEPSVLKDSNQCVSSLDPVKIESKLNESEKILGLQWLNYSDELAFNFNRDKISPELLSATKKPTKREFLSIIMAIFDPLGLISPFTVRSRILMQDIWLSGVKWDEEIRDREFTVWKQWLSELDTVISCRIDRCYQLRDMQQKSAELLVFCDASSKAYGAVAYWRFQTGENSFHTSIIMSKSRVAPLKTLSIPRLELQAAVLATRLAKTIIDEHDFEVTQRVFWTDSRVVLHWIAKDPLEFKVHVANRLGEISENSQVFEWRWIPTRENPADDVTRANSIAFDKDSRWLLGPEFLRRPESAWPIINGKPKLINTDLEYRKNPKPSVNVLVDSSPLIDSSRFSSWSRLISTMRTVLRAVDLMRVRAGLAKSEDSSPVIRKIRAEKICLKLSQMYSFPNELRALKHSQLIQSSSRILQLNPILDKQGILRAEGRLVKFVEPGFDSRPIILDAKNHIVQFLIKNYHEKFRHANKNTVLNELRQKYSILGLRVTLISLISKCAICKILRGKPMQPIMAELPQARMAIRAQPFAHSGLDYFGPFHVKVGRSRQKRWGVIFTCLTTRAIYLDIAYSLSADSAIMALKRFISRRGTPTVLYCDNGTNFKGMQIELSNVMQNSDIDSFCSKNNIQWKFNPPSAPHMGGAWERLIRSVKSALFYVLKDQAMTDESLLTSLQEIEHTINSRPLTHVSLDPHDQEALTPNHFLIGASSGDTRFGTCTSKDLCSRKNWKNAQSYADECWRRWLTEYLPSLNVPW